MSRAFANNLNKEQTLEDGEIFEGDLVKEGKATWTCDSTSQWLWRGEDKEFQYLIDRWKEQGIYDDIRNGTIHIIWTGGEPTIKGHQQSIVNFFQYWLEQEGGHDSLPLKYVYNEIETNGTVVIDGPLFNLMDQINCSPKLSNSGMSKNQRFNEAALKRIMNHINYQFKFVISNEEDVQEIFSDFIVPLNIPLSNVVCMPGLDDVANFEERTQFVLEMAKKYKFRGLTRLHIAAWNKTLNV
jgi:organic radical activating enzyme